MNINNVFSAIISFVVGVIFSYLIYVVYDNVTSIFEEMLVIDPIFKGIMFISIIAFVFMLTFMSPILNFINKDN